MRLGLKAKVVGFGAKRLKSEETYLIDTLTSYSTFVAQKISAFG